MPQTVNRDRARPGTAGWVQVTIGGHPSRAQASFRDTTTEGYQAALEHLGETRYVDYPSMIGLETLAVCNASCGFCPYPTMPRKGDRMPDDLLARLLDEMATFPEDLSFAVCFSRVNEPFLDRRVYDIVDDMNRRLPQAAIWMYTNASPLSESSTEELCNWQHVDHFGISFNDHRPSEYERVMGIPYERTVENIDRLHGLRAAGELPFAPEISRVGDGTSIDDDFLDSVRARWPAFTARVWERFAFLPVADATATPAVPDVGCQHWFRLPILASGKVVFCCADSHGLSPIDDVTDRSMLEVYNEPSRAALRTGLPSRLDVDPCFACERL